MKAMKAPVFDLYRGTSHDGPGLRSTVFFLGCPLSCKWCHNPEGIGENRIWWQPQGCIGCGECKDACLQKAVSSGQEGISIDDEICLLCGNCVESCPAKALALVAEERDLDYLFKEVLKDKAYYDRTGGGVTASGGECLLHHEIIKEFFIGLQKSGVNTALDTSGFVSWPVLESVLPHTDFVLYDLKLFDTELHRKYTGQSNELILDNARNLAKSTYPYELWIRTPLVSGITDTTENIGALAGFIREELHGEAARWELCAFNNSCIKKYQQLGLDWPFKEHKPITRRQADELKKTAVASGLNEDQIAVTGIISE